MSNEAKCPFQHGLDPSKQDLTTLPSRMRNLPVDDRGFVVPWFVDKDKDGKPEFRAVDTRKFVRALNEKRCWVCGDQLGRFITFVAGPMCGVNRTSGEPPAHYECALWSAMNCPWLSNPMAERRVDEAMGYLQDSRVGAIQRNPGVTMLWVTRDYSVWKPKPNQVLITMGEPERVEFYKERRRATRDEVLASIESGLPHLQNVAVLEQGGLAHLNKCVERFSYYLPAAVTSGS